MRSPKQVEASRINGRRSQGPVTPEGKYNSSRNNTRHGLLAQTVVLERESEPHFLALLDDYMHTHQPQSPTEVALVETMVVALWRMWRIWGMQKLALDMDIAIQDPEIGPSYVRAMHALRGTPDAPARPDVLVRYETTYDRQYKSAVRLLESLTKRRKSPPQPYHPTHLSGHYWKPEPEPDSPTLHSADLASEQEPDTAALPDPLSDPPNRDGHGAGLPSSSESREGCDADLQADQETNCAALGLGDSSNRDGHGADLPPEQPTPAPHTNPKMPPTVRPQQVIDSRTPPKSDPNAKRDPKIDSLGVRRRADPQVRERPSRQPAV